MGNPVAADAAVDVLGIGCSAVDELLYVEAYPPPDTKTPILRRERHGGGLTATALVAAARLGSRCAFAGVLGEDELSRFVVERFRAEGVNTDHMVRREGARPFHAIIVVDDRRHTRTIFYEADGVIGADLELPAADVIRSCRVLFVDHVGDAGAVRAAQIAREAGIPVVGDLENDAAPRFSELLALVDHLILSQVLAARLTGTANPSLAAGRLRCPRRNTIVVTCGDQGCWWVDATRTEPAVHQPAYAVDVVDTTGCGDVFHGAYASALARGLELAERVRFASAAAALKATGPGGQTGIPTRTVVEAFLQERCV